MLCPFVKQWAANTDIFSLTELVRFVESISPGDDGSLPTCPFSALRDNPDAMGELETIVVTGHSEFDDITGLDELADAVEAKTSAPPKQAYPPCLFYNCD